MRLVSGSIEDNRCEDWNEKERDGETVCVEREEGRGDRQKKKRITNLGHGTTKGYSGLIAHHALPSSNGKRYTIIGGLIDDSPQLGLDLELNTAAPDLFDVTVTQDVEEDEVADGLGEQVYGLLVLDGRFPREVFAVECFGVLWFGNNVGRVIGHGMVFCFDGGSSGSSGGGSRVG